MYEGKKLERRERDFENMRETQWREKEIFGGAGMHACLYLFLMYLT